MTIRVKCAHCPRTYTVERPGTQLLESEGHRPAPVRIVTVCPFCGERTTVTIPPK